MSIKKWLLDYKNGAVALIITTAIVSGVANFLNKFAMTASDRDAFQYTTLKNILAAVFLTLCVTSPLIWKKLSQMSKKDWLKLAFIGLVGGSIPFLLFFKGLSLTSSVSASFIHKTLFIWVALLAWPILKEKISRLQFLALGVLLLGNVMLSGFKSMTWGVAESLIFLATIFWTVETVMAKKFLQQIDAVIMAWGRMFFGAIFLLIYLSFTGHLTGLINFNTQAFGWLILTSLLLFAYVYTWFGALKILPAGVVTCFLVLASPITTLLSVIFVTKQIDGAKIFGIAVILLGLVLFFNFRKHLNSEKSSSVVYAK